MKKYINLENNIYTVKFYKEGMKLKDSFAYIIGEYVYPYKGKIKKHPKDGIGIYVVKDTDEIVLVRPIGNIKKEYSIRRIYTLTSEYIGKVIHQEGVKDLGDEALTSEIGEIFAPPINEDDNELQCVIKTALKKKKIDLKNYESRFKNATDMNNFKKALLIHGTMSMKKFNKWCEILDIDYELRFKDKKDCPNPMKYEGSFSNK